MSKPNSNPSRSSNRSTLEDTDSVLSMEDLSSTLGGQSRSDPGQELADQFEETLHAWGSFIEPLYEPVRQTGKLLYDAGSYVRWRAEYLESHEISDERAAQLEQEEREREAQKQEEEARERELLLQGDEPTTAADVAQWLGLPPPPQSSEAPMIPTHMVNPGPSHEPQIILEEIPDGLYGY